MKFASAIHLTILIPLLGIQFASVLCQNITSGESAEPDTKKLFHLPGLDRFQKVRVNERNFGLVRNMHANWYAAGVKALMAKLGRDLYLQLDNGERRTLAACLDRIEEKRDLTESAKCLVNARRAYFGRISVEQHEEFVNEDELESKENGNAIVELAKAREKTDSNGNNKIAAAGKEESKSVRTVDLTAVSHAKLSNEEGHEHLVEPADVVDQKNNSLNNQTARNRKRRNVAPRAGDRFKRRLRGVDDATDSLKQSTEVVEWAKRLRRMRKGKMESENVKELQHQQQQRRKSKWAMDTIRPKFLIRQAKGLDKLPSQQDKSAVIRLTNLITKLTGSKNCSDVSSPAKWTRMYDTLVRLKRANDKRRESPGARVYEMRMYDLVLARDDPSLGPKEKKSPQGLLQMGISLLQQLAGNGTSRRNANLKWMSPRFAPLMPDKSEASKAKSFLSPTIFALYEPEKSGSSSQNGPANKRGATQLQLGPDIASMPEVLKATGLNKQDREALMQSLMEVSGSLGNVQMAMDLLKSLNFFDIEPELTETSDRILGAYTKMERSFEPEQEREIERQGWTSLRGPQFEQLCRDQHADFPADIRAAVDHFGKLRGKDREQALWKRVERIARNIPDEIGDKLDHRRAARLAKVHLSGKERRRRRRQSGNQDINWLSVLKPVILQPYMFTPVYGLSVLGPLVLSPNIFSPLILAPSVLGPYILSPAAPIPFILSPYVFGPFILSPMALAPFILTPYVLSPNILNPFALSPLILSPTVLSPDILSPQVLGGGILSPTVGSPAVLTESALMASVLSPSVLS